MLIHGRQALRNQIYEAAQRSAPDVGLSEPPPDLSLVIYPNEADVLFCAGLGWDVIDWDCIANAAPDM